MKKLRNHIKESFFNPIFHFIPLLIFMVVEDYYGLGMAWKWSLSVAFVLLGYVFFAHKPLFYWHLLFTLFFFALIALTFLELLLPIPDYLQPLIFKSIVFYFVVFVLILRKQVEKAIFGIMSKLIPMSNNFNELYRVIWALLFVILMYITAFLFIHFSSLEPKEQYFRFLIYVHSGVILLLVVFELVRVQIIRTHLVKEEWWPIVTEQGKIIGSIEHSTSLTDTKKYIHPIVRGFMIEKGMVFLQKNKATDLLSPGLWDTVISNHLRMGESIDQCVERTALEEYGIDNFKYIYLSSYLHESKNEKQYAFIFVSCQNSELNKNSTSNLQTKWWTQQQIEENLETGIFSDNFKIEFDLLKRSGLLETGRCECSCKLKEVIYQQTDASKQDM